MEPLNIKFKQNYPANIGKLLAKAMLNTDDLIYGGIRVVINEIYQDYDDYLACINAYDEAIKNRTIK